MPYPPLSGTPLTQTLAEQIAAQLSGRIVSGAVAPGQRITEQAVAAEFAVSRGPVRDALRLLEKDGLVTILPRRGALVTNLSIAEVRELFDIRGVLNGLRDRLVAEDPDRVSVLPALEAEVANLTRSAREGGAGGEYLETVGRLEQLLTRAARNRRLGAIHDTLVLQTLRYRQLGLSTPLRRRQSVQQWQKFIRAIRDGDGAEAERLARQRVADSRDAAILLLQQRDAADKRTRRAAQPPAQAARL